MRNIFVLIRLRHKCTSADKNTLRKPAPTAHKLGRPGLVDERGWLIFLIYQNTIEPIAKRLLIPINGMITHSCRKSGGEKKVTQASYPGFLLFMTSE